MPGLRNIFTSVAVDILPQREEAVSSSELKQCISLSLSWFFHN